MITSFDDGINWLAPFCMHHIVCYEDRKLCRRQHSPTFVWTSTDFTKLWLWFALSTLFQGEIFLNFDENRSKCLIWTCWTYKPAWITGSSLPYMVTCRTRLWTLSRKNLMTTRENLLARPLCKNICPNQLPKLTHVSWPMITALMAGWTYHEINKGL